MSRTSAMLTFVLVGAFAGCAIWLGSCWAAPTPNTKPEDDTTKKDEQPQLGQTGTVHLEIVDADGNPIPNLLVLLGGEDPALNAWLPHRGQLTDHNGIAVLERVPGGTWPVSIPRAGWATTKKRIVVPGFTEERQVLGYRVELRRRESIPGRVMNPGGQPLPFVKLVLHHASSNGRRWSRDIQTGSDGDFELFRQDEPTTLRVELQDAGYRANPGNPMTFDLDGSPVEVVLTTSPRLTFG